ncbi:predicted protein [Botrytis cinerea T4]|uniref:Uncharacterized protein n=1 Tax=Botryotinia fuckeliana (strain T4) TaxID=999810 RepID=G2Y1L3_BOTF4|nr:predicted protein [Botrytis cinerea T4]
MYSDTWYVKGYPACTASLSLDLRKVAKFTDEPWKHVM